MYFRARSREWAIPAGLVFQVAPPYQGAGRVVQPGYAELPQDTGPRGLAFGGVAAVTHRTRCYQAQPLP